MPGFIPERYEDYHSPEIPPRERRFSFALGPEDFVVYLRNRPGYRSTPEEIKRKIEIPMWESYFVCKNTKQYFRFNENTGSIELWPTIQLCRYYIIGRCNPERCQLLHICIKYAAGLCYDEKCPYNHNWNCRKNRKSWALMHAEHSWSEQTSNRTILRSFSIDGLDERYYLKWFQKTAETLLYTLDICEKYIEGECNTEYCLYLHICLGYLAGFCNRFENMCIKNHKLTSTGQAILQYNKISVWQDVRLAYPPLVKNSSPIKRRVKQFTDSIQEKENYRKLSQAKFLPIVVRSDYPYGDVPIAEICSRQLVECNELLSVCPKLHSIRYFHWQLCASNKMWLNFMDNQIVYLEENYCKPEINNVQLITPVDDSNFPMDGLIKGELQNSKWKVDYKMMIISNEKGKSLQIRRLENEKTSNPILSYNWYHSVNNRMVDIKTTLDVDLEETYKETPYAVVKIFKPKSILIDLKFMKETPTSTKKPLDVVRRPVFHKEKISSDFIHELDIKYPTHLDQMKPKQPYLIVKLKKEFMEHNSVINDTFSASLKKKLKFNSIYRIQSKMALSAFNSTYEVTSKKKRLYQMMFYVAKPFTLKTIFRANIDYTLTKPNIKTNGDGIYFTTSFKQAMDWALGESKDQMWLILVRVFIGKTVLGREGMKSSADYDTSVDSLEHPKIFVKYDKSHYNPEYLIHLNIKRKEKNIKGAAKSK